MTNWGLFGNGVLDQKSANDGPSYLTEMEGLGATTNNIKGSWEERIASTNFQVCGILGTFGYHNSISSDLIDIGIGSSGNEVVIVENIAMRAFGNDKYNGYSVYFPISVAKGNRISVREQTTNISAGLRFGIHLFYGRTPNFGSYIKCYGALTSSDSNLTTVNTSASVDTMGSWTELSSGIDFDSKGMWICLNRDAAISASDTYLVDIGIGSSGNEVVIVKELWGRNNSNTGAFQPWMTGMLPMNLSAGTRISARCACNYGSKSLKIGVYCLH